MIKLKLEIEIDINSINIDEKYFNFNYIIKINGKDKIKGNYSDSYSGYKSKEYFKKVLIKGRAYQCVLDNHVVEEYI